MAWLGAIASDFVRRGILGSEIPPNRVLDVKPEQYSNRTIVCREDGIVLYGPDHRQREKFEIVLHRPCTETLHQAYRFVYSSKIVSDELKIPRKRIILLISMIFPVFLDRILWSRPNRFLSSTKTRFQFSSRSRKR